MLVELRNFKITASLHLEENVLNTCYNPTSEQIAVLSKVSEDLYQLATYNLNLVNRSNVLQFVDDDMHWDQVGGELGFASFNDTYFFTVQMQGGDDLRLVSWPFGASSPSQYPHQPQYPTKKARGLFYHVSTPYKSQWWMFLLEIR
jgi:hypothetical protein